MVLVRSHEKKMKISQSHPTATHTHTHTRLNIYAQWKCCTVYLQTDTTYVFLMAVIINYTITNVCTTLSASEAAVS